MSVAISAGLSDFDGGFSPDSPGGDRRPGVESLQDGDYNFEILSSTLELLAEKPVLRLGLQTGNRTIDHLFWIDSQTRANIVGAFLVGLGVPAHQWKKFSVELPKAVPTLRGLKFVGTKKTTDSKDGGKQYHNLYVKSLIGRGAGNSRPTPPQPEVYDDADDADIPF